MLINYSVLFSIKALYKTTCGGSERPARKLAQERHEPLALPCPGRGAKQSSGSAISRDTARAIPRTKQSMVTALMKCLAPLARKIYSTTKLHGQMSVT